MRVNLNTSIYSVTNRQNSFGSYNDSKPTAGWTSPEVVSDSCWFHHIGTNAEKGRKLFSEYLEKNVRMYNPNKDTVCLVSDTVSGMKPRPKGIDGELIEIKFIKHERGLPHVGRSGKQVIGAYISPNDSPERICAQLFGMFQTLCEHEKCSVDYKAENNTWYSLPGKESRH